MDTSLLLRKCQRGERQRHDDFQDLPDDCARRLKPTFWDISFPTRIRLGTKHRMYACVRIFGYEDTMQVRLVVKWPRVFG
jgi:hypothetical protein